MSEPTAAKTPAQPETRDASLDEIGGTPEHIATVLHNDAVTRGGVVRPKGDSLRDIVRKYDEMLEPIAPATPQHKMTMDASKDGWSAIDKVRCVKSNLSYSEALAKDRDKLRAQLRKSRAHADKLAAALREIATDFEKRKSYRPDEEFKSSLSIIRENEKIARKALADYDASKGGKDAR